jgi:hypothetical protein
MAETAKDACDWSARHTVAFVYMALRNDALEWFDGHKQDDMDKQFIDAFLLACTISRTAMINIYGLKQGPNKSGVNS